MKTGNKPALSFALIALFALVVSTFLIAACNTTKGAGRDIEAAGAGLKSSAERNGAK
jgi:predicted small secreted protein